MKKSSILFLLFTIAISLSFKAQVSFTASVSTGCAPLSVNFVNTSTSGVTWDWNFGDGTPSSSAFSATHVYNTSGVATVWLTAFDAIGNWIGDYSMQINVLGPPQNFSLPNDSVCPSDMVNFYLYGNGDTWDWDFGDGTTFTENSTYGGANHTYSSPGNYLISVNVTNSCGTYTADTSIIVNNNVPFTNDPWFWIDADSTCPNTNIGFQVDNSFSSFLWSFGDGVTDVSDYATHAYTALGTYYVTLDVTNGCGASISLYDSVVIDNNVPVTGGSIWTVDSICPGEEFNIQGTSDNGATYNWDFGDGNPTVLGANINYSYATAGTYNVALTITNDCGNSTTINTQIVVTTNSPVSNAFFDIYTPNICPGDEFSYGVNDLYSFYVDFGDGTGVSSSSNNNWSHVYASTGTYPVSVTYQNSCGNSLTLYDTVYVKNNLPFIGYPYANINQNQVCINGEVNFYAQSGYTSYSWDFGDGATSTNKDAQHIYNTAGTYSAVVTITNGCGATLDISVIANIVDNLPLTDLGYQILGDSVCPNDELLFIGDDFWLEYTWDFGDGTSSNSASTSHSYANVGTYLVSVTGVNGCGNDTTLVDTVVVGNNVYPSASNLQIFSQPEGCIGDELYFVVGPSGAGTYTWDFGDGNTTTQTNPIVTPDGFTYDVALHSYLNVGNYQAIFSITNGCGNTYIDTLQVQVGTVGDTVAIDLGFWWDTQSASCQGQPIEFAGVGASSYSWNFGDGSGILVTQGSLTPVNHTYLNSGSYTITVTGYNQCGTSASRTEEIFIPQSEIDISTNAVQLANCGQGDGMAVVSASGGMPPYQYAWSNGDNSVIADSLYSGLYVITVTDNNDCSSEGIVTVDDNQGPTILVDNITNVNCYGQSNGTISVSILGGAAPYTIIWSNGDQTEDIFGLVAGPYEIFVTDANGCMGMKSITVEQPTEAVVSVVTQPADCGSNNGSAMAVISNGLAPYNYIWPNQTGPVAQTGGLAPGIYELLIIDANTCLLRQEFTINETSAPIILLDSIVTGTCSGSLSSIYINTIGGSGPFTYNWSDGSTNEDLTNVLPGDYSIQITGQNGCSSYMTQTVEMTLPEENAICVVTVDTTLGGNKIVWEPVQSTGVDFYNIYKESSQSGLYYLIGTTDADSLSEYNDIYSDPVIRSWRYKIAAVDNCGNEAPLSDEHKTIHLSANLGVGNVVNLLWDDYEGFAYSTYYVNRYHPTTGWLIIDSLASNLNSYTDATPPSDSNLIYTVTINIPTTCSAQKAVDHNTTRSNRGIINGPEEDQSLSVSDFSKFKTTLSPNPSDGKFTLYFERELTGAKVSIFDMQGKLLLNKRITGSGSQNFDISTYETGMYLIKIATEKQIEMLRIIKQ